MRSDEGYDFLFTLFHTQARKDGSKITVRNLSFTFTLIFDRFPCFSQNKNHGKVGSHREVFQKLMVIDFTAANEMNTGVCGLHTPVVLSFFLRKL